MPEKKGGKCDDGAVAAIAECHVADPASSANETLVSHADRFVIYTRPGTDEQWIVDKLLMQRRQLPPTSSMWVLLEEDGYAAAVADSEEPLLMEEFLFKQAWTTPGGEIKLYDLRCPGAKPTSYTASLRRLVETEFRFSATVLRSGITWTGYQVLFPRSCNTRFFMVPAVCASGSWSQDL